MMKKIMGDVSFHAHVFSADQFAKKIILVLLYFQLLLFSFMDT